MSLYSLETSILIYLAGLEQLAGLATILSLSVVPLGLLAALLIYEKRDRLEGLIALFVMFSSYLVATFFKYIINAARPFELLEELSFADALTPSFPSRHAVLAVVIAVLAASYFPRRKLLLYAWAVLVMTSRLVLGLHFPHDVIAGGLLGLALAWPLAMENRLELKKLSRGIKRHAFEVRRNIVHLLLGLITAAAILLFGSRPVAYALGLVLLACIPLLLAARKRRIIIVSEILDTFERKKPGKGLPARGAVFAGLGAMLAAFFFPAEIAAASVLALGVGDSLATVAGLVYGRTKLFYNKKKSMEGLLAGLAGVLVVTTIMFPLLPAALVALTASFFESLDYSRLRLDDNLVIPIAVAVVLSVV